MRNLLINQNFLTKELLLGRLENFCENSWHSSLRNTLDRLVQVRAPPDCNLSSLKYILKNNILSPPQCHIPLAIIITFPSYRRALVLGKYHFLVFTWFLQLKQIAVGWPLITSRLNSCAAQVAQHAASIKITWRDSLAKFCKQHCDCVWRIVQNICI